MNQRNNSIPPPNSTLHNLAQTVSAISSLPNAPTSNWPTQAAIALSKIAPKAAFAVVITNFNTESHRINTDASGVSMNPEHPAVSNPFEAKATLDRLGSLNPIHTNPTTHPAIITTPQSLLPHWYASDASNHWRSPPPQQTLVSFSNLKPRSSDDVPTDFNFALICIATPNPFSADLIDHDQFASAMSILNHKAATMLTTQPTGTINWLTQREQAILDQLILGSSVKEIANNIERSPHTVHDHVKSLHKKLNASSRGQLITKALGYQSQCPLNESHIPQINPEVRRKPTADNYIEPRPETQPESHTQSRIRAQPLNR